MSLFGRRPLKFNSKLGQHQYVYILPPHPWSDCAGHYLGIRYIPELERSGARVLLDEGIEVMVWHAWQLRALGEAV